MARRGRKGVNLITPEQEQMFLQLVSLGMYPSEAAKKIGVTPQAISMRKKRSPDFRMAIDRAEASFELGCLAVIVKSQDPKVKLELIARRFPERWARAEIRANLNTTTISAQDVVDGIHQMLTIVGKRHAAFDQPDVDAGEDREPGAGPDDQGEGGPDDQGSGVTRG